MSFYEMNCFAKVYSIVFGCASPSFVSQREVEVALDVLKRMADNRNDWTQEEKESYKLLVDFTKEYLKGGM